MAPRHKAKATAEEVRSDLAALRKDLGILADQVGDILDGKSDDVIGDLNSRINRIREHVSGAISEVSAKGSGAAFGAKESFDGVAETLEESVRDRPFMMLAFAVGLGVIVGAAMRR